MRRDCSIAFPPRCISQSGTVARLSPSVPSNASNRRLAACNAKLPALRKSAVAQFLNSHSLEVNYCFDLANSSTTRFTSSGTSTLTASFSTSATRIFQPFSIQRNCSNCSMRSSSPCGSVGYSSRASR